MITDLEIGLGNLISLGLTASASLVLLPFLRRRPELRVWFAGEAAIALSFLCGIMFRWGGGDMWSLIDSSTKLIAACCAASGIVVEYRKNSPSPGGPVILATVIALMSWVVPVVILYCIIGGGCAWAFFLGIRNYQRKRTPSHVFIVAIIFIIMLADVFFLLDFLVPDLTGLQAWIAFGNIAMAAIICAFSVVVRVEEDFEQSHQMHLNLITMAAHELKTPLIPIYGWADLMIRGLEKGQDLNSIFDREAAQAIFRNAERLQAIIDRFLDVNAIESGRIKLAKERTQLTPLISRAIQSVASLLETQGVSITSNLGDERVNVDPFRMEQVFINLLSNAIKFSPPGSKMVLGSAIIGKFVEVFIQDQGIGFDPEELPEALELFSPAYLRHHHDQVFHSSGVGLFLCKNLVEMHGGTLRIESPGKNLGTTVRVALPHC